MVAAPELSGSFKDPYFFDFLDLPDGYLERDLEQALIRELERFILELGKGFAFVERQKRMIIGGEDFYLDLLFYHRRLKRLVAVELMNLQKDNIMVAQYWTELPPKAVLEAKLHTALIEIQARLAERKLIDQSHEAV